MPCGALNGHLSTCGLVIAKNIIALAIVTLAANLIGSRILFMVVDDVCLLLVIPSSRE